jgi:hypothetical protein
MKFETISALSEQECISKYNEYKRTVRYPIKSARPRQIDDRWCIDIVILNGSDNIYNLTENVFT